MLLVRGGIMSRRKSDAKALSHLTDAVIVRDQLFMKKMICLDVLEHLRGEYAGGCPRPVIVGAKHQATSICF